ncbi:arylamine N-acetyltransferase family protein [Novosphingobium sp. M1R2S20]|uniref:Arylamine N-acetyltransferase n=1 Tax=Novosphingobium rhizovicinum TaxID=3228928 RepID=A0ABV3R6F8_9SPHN
MQLERYLARIGLPAAPVTDPEGLARLQRAHRLAIGFENLDVRLGRGIAIDEASVFEKLVVQERGGYCFEQNRLLSDALSALGVPNRPLLARVWLGVVPDVVPPRTHVCLLATIDGEPWLMDAGFGGSNLPPLPMRDGAQAITPDGAAHRLVRTEGRGALAGEWKLERAGPSLATDGRAAAHDAWQPQYSFDLAEVAAEDLEQANHWTSTRPGTRFTTLHIASIVLENGFAALTDRELTVYRESGAEKRSVTDLHDYRETLRSIFRIRLSAEEVERLPLFA